MKAIVWIATVRSIPGTQDRKGCLQQAKKTCNVGREIMWIHDYAWAILGNEQQSQMKFLFVISKAMVCQKPQHKPKLPLTARSPKCHITCIRKIRQHFERYFWRFSLCHCSSDNTKLGQSCLALSISATATDLLDPSLILKQNSIIVHMRQVHNTLAHQTYGFVTSNG